MMNFWFFKGEAPGAVQEPVGNLRSPKLVRNDGGGEAEVPRSQSTDRRQGGGNPHSGMCTMISGFFSLLNQNSKQNQLKKSTEFANAFSD